MSRPCRNSIRQLARRSAWSGVSVKKRFDLPIHSFNQEQVRALYLGIGVVYSGDAEWDAQSGSWLVDRSQVVPVPAGGPGGSGWPIKEDIDAFEGMLDSLLKIEELPERGTATDVDLYTTAHVNATTRSATSMGGWSRSSTSTRWRTSRRMALTRRWIPRSPAGSTWTSPIWTGSSG